MTSGQRRRQVRALARLLTVLSLLVVALSAYLRLDGAGLGCPDWPECYRRPPTTAVQEAYFGLARLSHRVVATLTLLLAGYLFWQCRRPPAMAPVARATTVLLLLMLALAALGAWSSDPRSHVVGFLNIVGGLALVSFSWRIVLAVDADAVPEHGPAAGAVLRLGAAALTLTVVFGASIGASYAALACLTFPACAGHWWPVAGGWQTWSPLGERLAAGADDAGGVTLHLLHRYGALLSVILLGSAAFRAMADDLRRPAATALALVLACTAALGVLTVVADFPLWLAIGHAVCAAALLATVATLLRR